MTLETTGTALRRTTPVWIATALAMVIASAVVAVTPTQANAIATPVPLGTAASFAVLAGSEITNTGPSVITGDLGVSPGTVISGFQPGIVFGAQHSGPTDQVGLQAKSDLVVAYNNAAGQASDAALPPDAGGLTLVPNVHTASSTLGLTGTLTLDAQGDPAAVWVFQVGSGLTTATSSNVSLINGASPCNVFWQIGSSATLGTETNFAHGRYRYGWHRHRRDGDRRYDHGRRARRRARRRDDGRRPPGRRTGRSDGRPRGRYHHERHHRGHRRPHHGRNTRWRDRGRHPQASRQARSRRARRARPTRRARRAPRTRRARRTPRARRAERAGV
ncbi:ice-binding family protein, partial [Streptomyces sp. NPDC055254]